MGESSCITGRFEQEYVGEIGRRIVSAEMDAFVSSVDLTEPYSSSYCTIPLGYRNPGKDTRMSHMQYHRITRASGEKATQPLLRGRCARAMPVHDKTSSGCRIGTARSTPPPNLVRPAHVARYRKGHQARRTTHCASVKGAESDRGKRAEAREQGVTCGRWRGQGGPYTAPQQSRCQRLDLLETGQEWKCHPVG